MRKFPLLFVVFIFSAIFVHSQKLPNVTQGSLFAFDKKGAEIGACPLKHTSVKANISGFLTRVTVTQEFENNFKDPIEAVYTFPLSQNSAVDDMTMRIGERVIRGKIMKREEAQKVYETAKAQGKTASLLDQERPNIFTQSVANIMPNEKIVIEISYVETLKYEDGVYEFVFPMVVGPRYIPASVSPTEAQKISPPVATERAGHDISIEVNLDAGVPVEAIRPGSHEIMVQNLSANSAKITLKNENTIPNKDFILRFDVTGKRIEDAVLTHRAERGGFFSLILSPPENFGAKDITPKEIVFVLDTSGSMNGFPIEKAKEAMKLTLEGLNPQDTFNIITFAGETSILFDLPVAATPENLARAKEFLKSRQGMGGTEMMKAITAALAPTESQKHLRVVCFMTDGYVGNEAEIISEVQKYKNARIFSFGIGSAVNRYLLDKIAEEGRGEVEYVSLQDDGSAAAKRFYERVRAPLLTDISVEWNGLPVADVYPKRNPDLFSAKPVIINGRYTKPATGALTLRGKVGGQDYVRNIAVNFPETETKNDVLAVLWARKRIDELTKEDYRNQKSEIREQITQLGLEFRLLTPFTSFVAVEEKVVNENGQPKRVEVPVELPEGVNRETTLGGFYRNWVSGDVSYIISGDPQGFLTQSYVGRKTTPLKLTANSPANVTGLTLTENESQSAPGIPNAVARTANNGNSVLIDGKENTNNNSSGSILSQIFIRIENHQKALRSLQAGLKMEKFDSILSTSEITVGELKYLPSKDNPSLQIKWTKPVSETFTLIGENFVVYSPRLKRAITGKTGETKIPFELLSISSADLKKKYNIAYYGQQSIENGIQALHLELTPKEKGEFKKIEAWFDASGMLVQLKLMQENGDWIKISLSNLQKNINLSAADFKLELPKNTQIIKN